MAKISPLNAKDLHKIFKDLDQNGDSLLSVGELNWLLERIGVHVSLKELETIAGKSTLNFDEFLEFYDSIRESGGLDEETYLFEAFSAFDLNGDGFISCSELQSVLSSLGLWNEKGRGEEDCTRMICKFDVNSDGLIDFQEFKKMMMDQLSS